MPKSMSINTDAFSSGQIGSKIWLCEKLEQSFGASNETIWILGGWHGVTALLILSRGIINAKSIRSFDIDPTCEPIADMLLNNWVWQDWKFKAFTQDCNTLLYDDRRYGELPSMVINTSCEHFDSLDWYDRIPAGTKVALQANDMNHDDHISKFKDLDNMKKMYKLSKIKYQGTKYFRYPTWSFARFMLIGYK